MQLQETHREFHPLGARNQGRWLAADTHRLPDHSRQNPPRLSHVEGLEPDRNPAKGLDPAGAALRPGDNPRQAAVQDMHAAAAPVVATADVAVVGRDLAVVAAPEAGDHPDFRSLVEGIHPCAEMHIAFPAAGNNPAKSAHILHKTEL